MPITVEIPSPMRDLTDGATHVAVAGANVAEVLQDLVEKYPAMNAKLYDGGKLRHYINVLVNDEDIRYLDELDTPVADGQTVTLMPAVSGG